MGRSKGAVIGFYHLHTLLVVAVAIASCIIEFSFAADIGWENYRSYYRINFFSFMIGACAYAVAYFFIWKKLLGPDWSQMKKHKAGAGWYVWLSAISLGAAFWYFIISFVILATWYDFPYFKPVECTTVTLLTILYSILLPVGLLIADKVRNK